MDDFRKDEILYDEDWLRIDTPVIVDKASENTQSELTDLNKTQNRKEKKKRSFPALITIQLVICLILAFFVFMLKAMNSQTYKDFCDWYNDMMQDTVLSNSTFEDIDLSEFVKATTDQVKASTDEI